MRDLEIVASQQASDMALELIVLPVADVDRAKAFYERVGFVCDVDDQTESFRVVQFRPPGSHASISFGYGLGATSEQPVVGLHLVVTNLEEARGALIQRGIDVGEPFHFGPAGQTPGVDPAHADFASFAPSREAGKSH